MTVVLARRLVVAALTTGLLATGAVAGGAVRHGGRNPLRRAAGGAPR